MAAAAPVPPRRYTAEELLALRASLPFVTCAVKNLNQHPDLGYIVHIPDAARRDPEHFSCKSSTLVEITNGKKTARYSESDGSESQHLTDALQKQQWNLRARNSSDHPSQPRAAPATKAAQRSENFQKFYRAVVSPTHVRVTAGGRIVPNTRAPAPSQLDWDDGDPTSKQTFAAPNNSQPQAWQSNNGHIPVLPNVFAPPFAPLPHGNLLPMPLPLMASHLPQSAPGADHGSMGHFQMPPVATDASGNTLPPGLIKISPPTQFDQSRPFLYNGQWVYPVGAPPATTSLPITMLGNPSFFTPPMPSAGFMQPQFPIPMAGVPQPMGYLAGPHATMMASTVAQQSEAVVAASSFSTMLGMGLNADFLKTQVSGMRVQLKQIEDQISSTKGQADQLFLEQQRTYLLSQISSTDAMIEHQRAHEAKEANSYGNIGSAKTADASKQSTTESGPQLVTRPPVVVSSSMANAKKGDIDEVHKASSQINTKTQPEPSSKSRLSIAAALAPPFQPRSQLIIEQSQQPVPFDSPSSDYLAVLDANPQMKAEVEARFAANALNSWNTPSSAIGQPYVTFSNGPITHGEPIKKHDQPADMHRSNPSSETMKTRTEEMFSATPASVPYLVGTFPRDCNPFTATESELVYPRPLTDEEIRARHLYWGKAPRSVQRGLPKFDGKDFYPPSPIKGKVAATAITEGTTKTFPVATPPPMQDPSFENLFASPYTPTYRSPAANTPGNDWVSNGPMPAQPKFQSDSQASQQEGFSFKSSMSTVGPTAEEFSGLFLEPGMSDYIQSPSADGIKETVIYYKEKDDEIPMTPDNPDADDGGDHDEIRTQDSWEQDGLDMANSNASHSRTASRDDACSPSTVEINLGQLISNSATEQTFKERVDNFRQTEKQTQFLQNILKKEVPMVGSALSGTVSSATAQGYLPPYFGSAAASLTPSVANLQFAGTDGESLGNKREFAKNLASPQPGTATSFLSENRPLNSELYHRAEPPATTAEGYMRYLSDKDEKDKQLIEQGWNANTTGIGPVNGPDW